ncbi:MAG: hypothetical protein FIB08_15845 [Candidatus Methanoperedens sp.]|nr:hypothetical protein [Candidatus Methanoperedens sp.]
MSLAEAFVEIYSVSAAFMLIFLVGQVLFMMRKVNGDLLKARLFLNENVTQKTWIYILIAGAAFALNALVKLIIRFTAIGEVLNGFYLVELSQIIFLSAFTFAVYNWHIFIHTLVSRS